MGNVVLRQIVAAFAIAVAVPPVAAAQPLDRPLRAVHISGNWGENPRAVRGWEEDRTRSLVPSDHIEFLRDVHVDWVGVSVALHIEGSTDSTVERAYSGVAVPTFTDDALRQIVREFRARGFNVYLTLAIESFENVDPLAVTPDRPLKRWQLGDPGDPVTGVPPDHENCPSCVWPIAPEFWPWRPSHPDHERFVGEFWRTYAEQAVHFARIAQEEGVRMYSLGTETDRLFRTRPGDDYWRNDFHQELGTLVDGVRAVYDGVLTYDRHYSTFEDDREAPGSRYLWEDLDLDVIGVSAWFPLAEEPPTTVMSVDSLRREYERIFGNYLLSAAAWNPGRPIVFLEYGTTDTVEAPANPAGYPENGEIVFSDANGNGIEDGQETQANIIRAFFETMNAYPGLVYGAFFWDNWIASNDVWESVLLHRTYSFRGKPAEEVVRGQYDGFRSLLWLPARTLYLGGDPVVVPVAGAFPNASSYQASSSAPAVAAVSVSGSSVTVSPVAEGVAAVTVTSSDVPGATLQFTVAVRPDPQADRRALEALYRATGGDGWTNKNNWLSDAPLKDWHGVEVDEHGVVIGLRLGAWDESQRNYVGNGLTGRLPPELGALGHLRRLQVEGNARLAGAIPAELGNLTTLRWLHFGGNALTGAIPAELGNLTHSLKELNLGGNALTGPLPETLANLTNLEWLSLWGDKWNRRPPPSWLGDLTNLRALDLGGHRFAGSIPAAWQNLGNLNQLYLWGNILTGPIPPWFGSLANLESLNLNGNALTGPIPASLTGLSGLTVFDIGGTGVCVPDDPAIRAWLATIPEFLSSGLTCEESERTFTDDPIAPGVTPIKAVHFLELRTRIDALRVGAGLPRFGWTDPVLRMGVMPVRLAHLLELRTAVAEAYTAAGRSAPSWTDAAPAGGVTSIRAAHLMELRAVVLALE